MKPQTTLATERQDVVPVATLDRGTGVLRPADGPWKMSPRSHKEELLATLIGSGIGSGVDTVAADTVVRLDEITFAERLNAGFDLSSSKPKNTLQTIDSMRQKVGKICRVNGVDLIK